MNFHFSRLWIAGLLLLNLSCAEKKNYAFSFVQLSDTQLGFSIESYEKDVEVFKEAVSQINTLNPDFVVICGDLVNNPCDSTYTDFLKIKEQLKMPCYVVPGNHDVGNIPNETSLNYYRQTIGRDYFDFQYNGYFFIMTNSQLWKSNIEEESGKHDLWFRRTLKKHSDKGHSVFVIGHYPLYTEGAEEDENYFNLPPVKREELLKLFRDNNVIAYLAGHSHRAIINRFEDILLVAGETTSRNFDKRPFGFRLWHVNPDSVRQQFVEIKPSIPCQKKFSDSIELF